MTDDATKEAPKKLAAVVNKETVFLATWTAPGDFIAFGEMFKEGVQREVSKDFAKQMEGYPNLDIVKTEVGSEEDVRVPEYVVPVQPDEDPIDSTQL